MVLDMAALAAMVGGLLPTLLVSRLFIFVLRRIYRYSLPIILTGHLLSLCISILLSGFGSGTDGFDNRIDHMLSWDAFVSGIRTYLVPQMLWVLVEISIFCWRRRDEEEA
ncbi:MAG: hypothetical protein ACI9JL_003189 [Paracoccaceae bacterium]